MVLCNPIKSSAVLCISWKPNGCESIHPHVLQRWNPLICRAVELGNCTRRNSFPTIIWPSTVIYLSKAICRILGGKLHTHDGVFENILLPCFGWQGFIFQTEPVILIFSVVFVKQIPTNLCILSISLWFTLVTFRAPSWHIGSGIDWSIRLFGSSSLLQLFQN